MKVKHVLLTLTILAAIYVLYLNFQTSPDVKAWNLFGWNFGISFSSHIYEKLAVMGLFALYAISVQTEKETENENLS